MDLSHPIFQPFYDKVVKNISVATAAVYKMSMKKAAIKEKQMYKEKRQIDYGIWRWLMAQTRIFIFIRHRDVNKIGCMVIRVKSWMQLSNQNFA